MRKKKNAERNKWETEVIFLECKCFKEPLFFIYSNQNPPPEASALIQKGHPRHPSYSTAMESNRMLLL